MPQGTVTTEGVVLFLHVVGMLVAFGPTFAYAIFLTAARSNPRSVPSVLRGIETTEKTLGIGGLAVLLAAGLYLVADENLPWNWDDTFVVVGLIGITALIAMHFGFFAPRTKKAQELCERDLAAGDTFSEEFERNAKVIGIGGQLATLILLVVIFFMTVKP